MTQDSLKSDRQFIARVDSTGIPNDKSGRTLSYMYHGPVILRKILYLS